MARDRGLTATHSGAGDARYVATTGGLTRYAYFNTQSRSREAEGTSGPADRRESGLRRRERRERSALQ